MSDKKYIQYDYSSGQLFEYNKTPKQGFEKHVNSKGTESYRLYYPMGVEGTLSEVSIRDSAFGKQLSIALKEGIYINFGINDQKANIDQNTESVIRVLPEVNKGDTFKISAWKFTPEGEDKVKQGMTFFVNGEKVRGLSISYTDKQGVFVKGDVPALDWKKNAIGQNKPTAVSVEAKNDYLATVLAEQTNRLKWERDPNYQAAQGSTPSPEEGKVDKSCTPPAHDDSESLPF